MRLLRLLERRFLSNDPDVTTVSVDIPDGVRLLADDLPQEWQQFLNYGKGPPGVVAENENIWVVRDLRGRPVGGARVLWASPPAIDVEIAPRFQRKGYATMLYEALNAAGFDTEAASDHAVATGMMTPAGYAFMVGRRKKRIAGGLER